MTLLNLPSDGVRKFICDLYIYETLTEETTLDNITTVSRLLIGKLDYVAIKFCRGFLNKSPTYNFLA